MATTASTQASAMRRLLQAAVTGDRDAMGDLVTADVTGWSPNLFVTSRDDLLTAMERRDDAFSGIEVQVQALEQVGDKAIAEWHVAVDHTGLLVVDDIALVTAAWTITNPDSSLIAAATSAEVLRRGVDGTWAYIVDHPFAGPPSVTDAPP